jgi:CHASE2 domain
MKKIRTMLSEFLKKYSRSHYAWAIVAALSFIVIFAFSFSSTYDLFEQKLYDLRFQIKPKVAQWKALCFLDIDDVSIANVGEYPWPRTHYAVGLETLQKLDARMALFDIQFINDSPRIVDKDNYVRVKTKAQQRQNLGEKDIDSLLIDNDAVLAAAVKKFSRVALPFSFAKQKEYESDTAYYKAKREAYKLFLKKASVPVPAGKEKLFSKCIVPDRIAIQTPLAGLVESGKMFGYVDSDFDNDGSERRVRLVRVFEDRIFFEMGLVNVMDLCGVKKEDVEIIPGDKIVLKNAVNPVSMKRADIIIPVDESCRMYINWAGGYLDSFTHIPFYALIEYDRISKDVGDMFVSWLGSSGNDAAWNELVKKRISFIDEQKKEKDLLKKYEISKKMTQLTSQCLKSKKNFMAN